MVFERQKGPKSSRRELKWHPKGAQGCQKGAKGESKGIPKGAKGSQKEPKVSQRPTKMHQKIDLRKRSRKEGMFGGPGYYRIFHFGSHFPLKINEKIDAKIDAEQVMKID